MTELALTGVVVEFGATTLFRDVSMVVTRGERWGVIGRNGSGKTTIFRLITGELFPTRGTVVRAAGARIAVLEQHRDFGSAVTVWEAAADPFAELFALEKSLSDQAAAIGEAGDTASPALLARYDRDLERFAREGGYEAHARVDAVLHGLGFDPDHARTQLLSTLSGGERGRVGLARQLVVPADVLLLDEPTNHLDLDTSRWLEEYLRGVDETVLIVSHDRAFLDRVVDHVLHLESETATSYGGDYSEFVRQRAERRLSQQRAFDKQSRTVAAEEDYIRRNIAGQNTKQAKGRRRRLERLPRLSAPPDEADIMALRLQAAARGGDQVLVTHHLRVAVEGQELLHHFSATLRREEVVGLIGPNGAGKTTLLRTLLGDREPDGGTARIGDSIHPAYYRQDMAQVPLGRTLFDIIHDLRPAWTRGQVQGHLGRFGFSGDSVLRKADNLSGGERARVALAIMMLAGANFLVFDEPTNHLDVESIEALEDAIDAYDGSVLLVSHDRALLRALCTRVWALADGKITDFHGTFAEWEAAALARERAVKAEATALRRQERERDKKPAASKTASRARNAGRQAQRAVEQAEAEVGKRETQVRELTRQLEDGALYATPDGAGRAAALVAELNAAKTALAQAYEAWERATAKLEEGGSRG